ncbi:MAG: bifunctional methylenetetrahydrofolate dehydrogenase/methenyltetrahydrofolate cyclohydrolase FolD [Cyanobacteria bacterium P01_H01_bin.74]
MPPLFNETAATLLDGKAVASQLHDAIQQDIQSLLSGNTSEKNPAVPKLVVVLVGDNPASHVYVNKKAKTAKKLGMASEVLIYPESTPQEKLEAIIEALNTDASVHGILVQLPLPKQINTDRVINTIAPEKDVDGLHPVNMGRLLSGDPSVCAPCTPSGIITLLKHYNIDISGKHAVILGRSNIVGKPMGLLLLQENATVTVCHSKTQNLAEITQKADILVAAVGIPKIIDATMVKPDAVVIDVGINRTENGLVGDVDFESVQSVAGFITPVPGGVGPMTIATLMQNTLKLYKKAAAVCL